MRRLAATIGLSLAATAPAVAAVPRVPHDLPGRAQAAAAGHWILGAQAGAPARAIARRHGARAVAPGTFVVGRSRAAALAATLARHGLLRWSEPDRRRMPRQVGSDPLSAQARWRDVVADPALTPPPVTPESPLLALIDSPADLAHPEFSGGALTGDPSRPATDFHGTGTAAVAAAPVNGAGMVGVWPGMRALNVALPERIRCSDSAGGIAHAVRAGAAVINMSYGSTRPCYAEYVALQRATAAGVTLVAAAGNEFADGNPLEFPASLPHVLTVAAIDPSGRPAYFSNANAAIDLSAPGVGILTAVPTAFDPDGNADGWASLHGTSFAAPMVAAAAAWVRQERPSLQPDQVAQVIRLSARDLGPERYDSATGFGLLDLGAALKRRPPPADPGEPNEEIRWVDGRALGRPSAAVWTGGRPRTLTGVLDAFEDPVDVYRLRMPPRSRVRVVLRPRFGDPDLQVFGPRARSLRDREERLAASRRRGRHVDAVTVVSRLRRPVTVYAVASVRRSGSSLDSLYGLGVRRLARRR